MFFKVRLHRDIYLAPKYFGRNIRETLHRKLFEEVEGTCTSRFGWVITVTQVDEVGTPIVQEGTGFVLYPLAYSAIVFKPFKGEVVDAVVINVSKMGCMAAVGPLQIYVSSGQIPGDMHYDEGYAPRWVSDDNKVTISKEDTLRLKIVGLRCEATEIFGVGTLMEDYLGPLE